MISATSRHHQDFAAARSVNSHIKLSVMDHRWGPRIPVDLPVRVLVPRGAAWSCRMLELSVSGALLATRRLLPEMTRVAVRATGPDGAQYGAPLVHGYVARCWDDRLALAWMDLAPPCIAQLIADICDPPRAPAAPGGFNSVQPSS